MNLALRVNGGPDGEIKVPFIFTNRNWNYLISGVDDDIDVVSHRTGRRGSMGHRVVTE